MLLLRIITRWLCIQEIFEAGGDWSEKAKLLNCKSLETDAHFQSYARMADTLERYKGTEGYEVLMYRSMQGGAHYLEIWMRSRQVCFKYAGYDVLFVPE